MKAVHAICWRAEDLGAEKMNRNSALTGSASLMEAWSLSGGETVFSERFDSEQVRVMCFSDGRRMAAGGPGENLVIQDLDKQPAVRRFPVPVSCFAAAGKRIVAGDEIGDVFLLELI